MVKMLRIEYGTTSIDIEDDKEKLWKIIIDPEFDWNTPLFVRDSTNPMNDIIVNLDRFISIKRIDNKQKTVEEIIREK